MARTNWHWGMVKDAGPAAGTGKLEQPPSEAPERQPDHVMPGGTSGGIDTNPAPRYRQVAKTVQGIGRRIRDCRVQRGLSLDKAAAALGVDMLDYRSFERGSAKIPAASLVVLAELFGMPVGSFFEPGGSQRRRGGTGVAAPSRRVEANEAATSLTAQPHELTAAAPTIEALLAASEAVRDAWRHIDTGIRAAVDGFHQVPVIEAEAAKVSLRRAVAEIDRISRGDEPDTGRAR